MAAEKRPEWLPAGWSMEVRRRKTGARVGGIDRYYTAPEIKHQFRSKNEIIRYLESRNLGKDVVESIKTSKGRTATTINIAVDALAVVEKSEDMPTWLPPGWTMEIRTRKGGLSAGTRYKCYIDPISGCKFYSKAEVVDYVQAGPMGIKSRKRKRRSINMLSMNNLHSECDNGCISPSESASVDLDEDAELGNSVSIPVNSVHYAFSPSQKECKRPKTGASNARRCLFVNPSNQREELHSAEPLMVAPISYIPMEQVSSVKEPSATHEEPQNLVYNELVNDGSNEETRVVDDEKQPKNSVSLETQNVMKAEDRATSQKLEDNMQKANLTPLEVENKSDNLISLQLDEDKQLENKGHTVEMKKQKEEQVLPEQKDNKPPENQEASCNTETKISSRRKMRAQRTTDLARRTSKRLAGLDPDVDPDSADPELALRQAKLGTKANSSLPRGLTGSSSVPCALSQLESHTGVNPADERAPGFNSISEIIPNTKPEAGKLVSDDPSSTVISPFGDSWPDPCLEFAFKTLTDAIPVDCFLQADLFSADTSAQLKSLAENRRENVAKG
ncbi:hypothetical protein H6P81_016923 [Aristolochia fimbriata]|uniref:MBD domain-containing protein n=1 Tax=Aristolochia fimbriata TaxID=158543 RepID=A0AAV7DYI7_ARIFI|nr:hypothetical protein H6P81_016923 [Aristolochia fimbriata]